MRTTPHSHTRSGASRSAHPALALASTLALALVPGGCGDNGSNTDVDAPPAVADAAVADAGPTPDSAVDANTPDADVPAIDAAGPDATPAGSDFYFESLGLVDDGPPLFIIVARSAWDPGSCTPSTNPPVPPGVLPAGFTLDAADPTNTSYRFNGPPADGIAALMAAGFTENNNLDVLC